MLRQLGGECAVLKEHLQAARARCCDALARLPCAFRLYHIRRERNGAADALANAAMNTRADFDSDGLDGDGDGAGVGVARADESAAPRSADPPMDPPGTIVVV